MALIDTIRDRSRVPAGITNLHWRPGLRSPVLLAAVGVVVGMAFVVSDAVAGHLRQTATEAALRSVESIVRGYVDPALREDSLDLDGARDPAIDDQLERLTLSGDIRQINLWSRDGSVAYSSDPTIRGRRFSIGSDLATAFSGENIARYDAPSSAAVGADARLAERSLEIFVPIRGVVDGNPIGVYEVFQDAVSIENRVAATRRDVFLVALVAAFLLLGVLWLAFAEASRRLASQNRQLVEQASNERRLSEDLRLSEERFRSVVRNSSDIIVILRPDGLVQYESPAVERVLGHSVESRVGRPGIELIHPDDQARYEYFLTEVLRTPGTEAAAEFRAAHGDGSWRVVEALAKNLLDEPAVGGILVNYRDVTERTALAEQLRHQAFHDSLTGLANRALLTDRLEHAAARRGRDGHGLAVLFIDLDDFKAVNDTLGHGAGDRVLTIVSERLRKTVRAGDTAARMGGDEFAVLLEDTDDPAVATDVAGRILDAIREPLQVGDTEIVVHASLGIALSSGSAQTADELLRDADLAMYLAKSEGKDRMVTFEPGHGDVALERVQLKADLHRAFDRNEFRLVYQPIVRLDSAAIIGFEALLRWRHPSRGEVSPTEFIPLAEESGLIVPLGRWVLETACREAAAWSALRDGAAPTVSVNVSARQIDDPRIVEHVSGALADAGLPARQLTLEITETALVRDLESSVSTLEQLKSLGVRLAIDDFGTGYSSLSYLRRFPVDILKIDRSFVATVGRGGADTAVVGSVLRLARNLQLQTVAEGIEDAVQLAELRAMGARLGQGFHFARPLEADIVASRLASALPPGSARSSPRTGRLSIASHGLRGSRPVSPAANNESGP